MGERGEELILAAIRLAQGFFGSLAIRDFAGQGRVRLFESAGTRLHFIQHAVECRNDQADFVLRGGVRPQRVIPAVDDLPGHCRHGIERSSDYFLKCGRQREGYEHAQQCHEGKDAQVSRDATHQVIACSQVDSAESLSVEDHGLREIDVLPGYMRARGSNGQSRSRRQNTLPDKARIECAVRRIEGGHEDCRPDPQSCEVTLRDFTIVERKCRRRRERQDAGFRGKVGHPGRAIDRQIVRQHRYPSHE